jgi:hypothetical protein
MCDEETIAEGETGIAHVHRAFRAACRAAPESCIERWYQLAGAAVRTRTAGRNLADRCQRAFAHLAIPAQRSGAQLTIDLWDEAIAGIGWAPDLAKATPAALDTGQGTALTYAHEGRIARYVRPGAVTWLDRTAQHIVGWWRQGQRVALAEQTRPLAPLLSIWLHDRDISLIHAGLVARDGRGILFAGPGGAGKSTATLACLDAGFQLLGDDQIALQEGHDGQFVGHSLFATARMEATHLARFPALRPYAIAGEDPDDPKSLLLLTAVAPRQLVANTPVHLLLLPEVVPMPSSRLHVATEGEAMIRLARSTLLAMTPSLGPDGLRLMARLVRRVPAYWLQLGRDLDTIPEQVDLLLASLDGQG